MWCMERDSGGVAAWFLVACGGQAAAPPPSSPPKVVVPEAPPRSDVDPLLVTIDATAVSVADQRLENPKVLDLRGALERHRDGSERARVAVQEGATLALFYTLLEAVRCWGWKRVPSAAPEAAFSRVLGRVPLQITTWIPASVAISAASTLLCMPPEPI